jgi:hypothetical protein
MTDKLKNNPEVRKAVVEAILDNRKKEKFGIDTETARRKINVIAKKSEDENFKPEDVKTVFEQIEQRADPVKMLKSDPRYLFQQEYFNFGKYADSFYDFEFDTVKEYLKGGEILKKFIDEAAELLNYLKSLEK